LYHITRTLYNIISSLINTAKFPLPLEAQRGDLSYEIMKISIPHQKFPLFELQGGRGDLAEEKTKKLV